jgi:predicted DNA binding CopG/RHH family protein
MNKLKLDKSEKDLLAALEGGELKSVLTPARKKLIRNAAEQTVKKDKRINIRISGRDLDAIQRRALEEGIPYQTLVSSVLHKYVSGGLHDVTANKSIKRTQ